MIEVRNLTKNFRDLVAVKDISFKVEAGDILGFLGRNGAGKTTTMRMITGYISPSAGSVTIDGMDVFDYAREVKAQIGYLPETPPLYLDMTALSYLRHVANLKGIRYSQIEEEIDRVCDRCGVTKFKNRLLGHLSKGQKQRVGLAQALLGKPKILILDEPTVGLDPEQIREIRSLIKELSKDHTIILSTHILSEVQLLCNRVIIIDHGELIANDTIENLTKRDEKNSFIRIDFASPQLSAKTFLKAFSGITKIHEISAGLSYEITLQEDNRKKLISQLLSALTKEGFPIVNFQNIAPTIEDIFLRTIREGDAQHIDTEDEYFDEEEEFDKEAYDADEEFDKEEATVEPPAEDKIKSEEDTSTEATKENTKSEEDTAMEAPKEEAKSEEKEKDKSKKKKKKKRKKK